MQLEETIEKLDVLFEENRGEEAQTLLENAIRQAVEEKDDSALLRLLNEMIGYKRETSQVEDSFRYAQTALKLMEQMDIGGSTAYATTLLNIANAYRAGGRLEESLAFYKEVIGLYEKQVAADDMLFASLYNNLSLLYQEMERFEEAKTALTKALAIVKENEDTYFEEAVTYANLAATCLQLNEDEEAVTYFKQSIRIFEEHGIKDAHYCAALSSMGTYYYKKHEYEKAADCFERAMEGVRQSLGENEYYQRLSENLAACRTASGRGLDLCREYYETYGAPMIRERFLEYEEEIAVGLCGEGSDCFGYDDALSRDHDWGPGFCMWVSDELYEKIGEKLKEAYEELPSEFKGYRRNTTKQGKARVGVGTVSGFYERLLGRENCPKIAKNVTAADFKWDNIPDEALAAAVNGEVFRDDEGTFTAVRGILQAGYPEKIFYLKAAEACARFSQSAQYNFNRMAERGDMVAAEISLAEGLRQAMKLVYYIEGEYPPHDKWLYRGIADKQKYEKATECICGLSEKRPIKERALLVEKLAGELADRLYEKDITGDREAYLEAHAGELIQKAVFSGKSSEELAEQIAEAEFEAFDEVRNAGGRASCQNDWKTFAIMRKSQYLTWSRKMLFQYLYDFEAAYRSGRNMIEEKYGRMMESTAPEEYAEIAGNFPVIPEEKKQIIEAIVQIQVGFMEAFADRYPHLSANARIIHTYEDRIDDTSYETYLRGEISTYSDKMLELYGRFVAECAGQGKNLAKLTMENSVHMYGYKSLEEAEKQYRIKNEEEER